jgi:hypothetical protein
MTTTHENTPNSIEPSTAEISTHDHLINSIEAIDTLKTTLEPLLLEQINFKVFIAENELTRDKDTRTACKEARDNLDKVSGNIDTLEQEVTTLKQRVSIETIIEHQTAIDTIQTELNTYQQLIDNQQQIIITASGQDDLTSQLIATREELLTDHALGNDTTAALKKLDGKLDTIQVKQAIVQADNQQAIIQATQTINGLNRRVTTTQERLDYLQCLTPKMLDILLMDKATAAAIEFNDLAQALLEKCKSLAAIDSLITELGRETNTGLFNSQWQFSLPVINSLKPQTYINGPDFLIYHSVEAVKQLKQQLLSQGVNFDSIMGTGL